MLTVQAFFYVQQKNHKKGIMTMQKLLIIPLIFFLFISLRAMQTEEEKHAATCKEWGRYLQKAAQATQVDAAMVHQIAANMQRDKCQNKVKGKVTRKNVPAFTQTHARISCPPELHWHPMNGVPFSFTFIEPEDSYDQCNFELKTP